MVWPQCSGWVSILARLWDLPDLTNYFITGSKSMSPDFHSVAHGDDIWSSGYVVHHDIWPWMTTSFILWPQIFQGCKFYPLPFLDSMNSSNPNIPSERREPWSPLPKIDDWSWWSLVVQDKVCVSISNGLNWRSLIEGDGRIQSVISSYERISPLMGDLWVLSSTYVLRFPVYLCRVWLLIKL